ncbi:hypothetical protein MASR1M101_23290 [Gemmatimonas sp.]
MPKGVRRLPGFDETVLALYARGLTTRELQGYLEERYQVPVSPDLISTVTSEVMEEVTAWQRRPLDPVYIAVVFDALRVKIRGEGVVQNKAVYLALGVLPDGTKRCSASGSRRRRAPPFGIASSASCSPAACRTSSWR